MTNDTTYRERGRALFLAAMIVLSVVAMSAAFAGAAAANYDNTDIDDEGDLGPVWLGETITLEDGDGIEDGHFVSISEGPGGDDGDTVVTESADGNEVEFETADLDEGIYTVFYHDGDGDNEEFNGTNFEIESEDFESEFTSSTVNDDTTEDIEFDSERSDSDRDLADVNVTSEDFDADDLEELFDESEGEGAFEDTFVDDDDDILVLEDVNLDDESYAVDFGDVDTGEYQFAFDVANSDAEDSANITVTDDDSDWAFTDVDAVDEGEIANITVDVTGTDEASIVLADENDEEFVHAAHLEDIDELEDDEVVIQYNTHTLEWELPDDYDDADITSDEIVADQNDIDHLVAYNWELSIGELGNDVDGDNLADAYDSTDNELEWENEGDRDRLVVDDRDEFGDINTYTLPADEDVSDLEEFQDAQDDEILINTSEITDQDGLFVEIEDFGAEGMIDELDGLSAEELYSEEGLNIALETDDGDDGPFDTSDEYVWATNETIGFGDDELDISLVTDDVDDYEGNLIFEVTEEITTDDADSIEGMFTVGDESAYVDDGSVSEHVFSYNLSERDVSWDTSAEEIGAVDGASVTGTTTVAPGTELPATIDSPSDEGGFVDTTDAVVEVAGGSNVSDGDYVFTAEFDLDGEEAGVLADLEIEDGEGVDDDEIETTLLEDDPFDDSEGISVDADYDATIDGDEETDIDAIVESHEAYELDLTLELDFDGEVYEENETVDGGDELSETLTTAVGEDLGDGDHDFTITVENDDFSDEYDGTVTVAEDDDDDAETDDDGEADDDADDETPGFGVAVAVVALLGAAMLALRQQN